MSSDLEAALNAMTDVAARHNDRAEKLAARVVELEAELTQIRDGARAQTEALEQHTATAVTNEANAELRADESDARAEDARLERDRALEQLAALEKDLASFSAELGLPPKIRPADGELRKLRDAAKEAQSWKETFEMYRRAWLRELGGTLPWKAHEIDAFTLATEKMRNERDQLLGFKNYVHRRLDTAGIEKNPKGPHADAGCRVGQRLDLVFSKLDAARAETERVKAAISKPEVLDFYKGLVDEAAHQRVRWAASDGGKTEPDWFWLIGYLAGKALHFPEKRLHHLITAAAALFNWHLATLGKTDMRPGIAAPVEASK